MEGSACEDSRENDLMSYLKNNQIAKAEKLLREENSLFWNINTSGESLWTMALDKDIPLSSVVELYTTTASLPKRIAFKDCHFPLHMCAKRGNTEDFKTLITFRTQSRPKATPKSSSDEVNVLSICCQDNSGDTALHIAVDNDEDGIVEAALHKRDSDEMRELVTAKNKDKETLLHICSRRGKVALTGKLLRYITDLDTKNGEGNTALHIIAFQVASKPTFRKQYIKIAQLIFDHSTKWYCRKTDTGLPKNKEAVVSQRAKAVHWLLEDISNDEQFNVLQYAHYVGAVELLQYIYGLEGVYKFYDSHLNCIFDVTGLSPETSPRAVKPEEDTGHQKMDSNIDVSLVSLSRPSSQGTDILNVQPCTSKAQTTLEKKKSREVTISNNTTTKKETDNGDLQTCQDNREEFTGKAATVGYADTECASLQNAKFSTDDECPQCDHKTDSFDRESGKGEDEECPVNNTQDELVRGSGKRTDRDKTQDTNLTNNNKNNDKRPKTCLDIVTELDDKALATRLLDASPMKYLIQGYFDIYRLLYLIILAIHIVDLGFLGAYPVNDVRKVWINKTGSDLNFTPNRHFGFFLVWPLLLLIYIIVDVMYSISAMRRKRALCIAYCKIGCGGIINFWKKVKQGVEFFFSNFGVHRFLGLSFCSLTITWFVLYISKEKSQVYYLGYALLSGWLYGITFARGFETVNLFVFTIAHIFLRDILTLLFIYTFILFAFSYAFYALFQVSEEITVYYRRFADVPFVVFGMVLGTDDIYDEKSEERFFEEAKSSTALTTTLYIIYILLCTIVLFNILIAMMSDTYADIRRNERTHWRVQNCAQAIRFEDVWQWAGEKLRLRRTRNFQHPVVLFKNRYYLQIPLSKVDLDVYLPEYESNIS